MLFYFLMWGIGYRPIAVYCPRVPRPYRQITPFSLFCPPQAYSVLWLQFSSWRGYIRFLLWRPGWAHQSKSGLVFRCCPSLHCATFGAADLRGSFNRAEHCVAVSIISPLTFSLLFPLLFFPSSLLSGGLGGPLQGGTASVLRPLMQLCLFGKTIKTILLYICMDTHVWLSFSLCL